MPADTSLNQAPSAHHGSAARPYACHTDARPPGADFIGFGGALEALERSPALLPTRREGEAA